MADEKDAPAPGAQTVVLIDPDALAPRSAAMTQHPDWRRIQPAIAAARLRLGAVRLVEEKRTVSREEYTQVTETIERIVHFDTSAATDAVAAPARRIQSSHAMDDPPPAAVDAPAAAAAVAPAPAPAPDAAVAPPARLGAMQALLAVAAGLALAWLLSPYSPIAGSYRLVPVVLPVVALAIALRLLAWHGKASRP